MPLVARPASASAVSASRLHGMWGTHAVARFDASAHSAAARSSAIPVRSPPVSLMKIPMRMTGVWPAAGPLSPRVHTATRLDVDAGADLLEHHGLGHRVHAQQLGLHGNAAVGEGAHHRGLEVGPVVDLDLVGGQVLEAH